MAAKDHGELKTDIRTLPLDILQKQQDANGTGDLSIVINAVSTACKW
jgi:hypothetical protein